MPLELLEYVVFSNQESVAANTFSAEIDLPGAVPAGETWRVDRISAVVNVPDAVGNVFVDFEPVLFVYDQANPGPTAIPLDITELSYYQTEQGAAPVGPGLQFLDMADYSSPLTIQASRQLALVFTVGFANTAWVAQMRVQYSRYQGTAGQSQPYAGAGPNPTIPAAI